MIRSGWFFVATSYHEIYFQLRNHPPSSPPLLSGSCKDLVHSKHSRDFTQCEKLFLIFSRIFLRWPEIHQYHSVGFIKNLTLRMLMIVPSGLSPDLGGDLYDMILISRQISHCYWLLKSIINISDPRWDAQQEIRDCGIDNVILEVKHNWWCWFTWDLWPDKSFQVNNTDPL